jgi:hypothetical protein
MTNSNRISVHESFCKKLKFQILARAIGSSEWRHTHTPVKSGAQLAFTISVSLVLMNKLCVKH